MRPRVAAVVASAAVVLLSAAPAAVADPAPPTTPAQITQDAAPDSEADTAAPTVDLGALTALDGLTDPSPELVAARDQLLAANEEAERAAEEFNAAVEALEEAQELERKALVELAAARVRELDAHRALGRFASEAYIAGGASANVAALLDAPSPTGLIERRNSMAAAGTSSADLVANVQLAQEQATAASEKARAAREAATAEQARAQTAKDVAADASAQALTLLSQLYTDAQVSQFAAQAELDAQSLRAQMAAEGVRDLTQPTPQAAAAVQLALAQVGKPYVWGAEGPDTFDCSGLTSWSYHQAGIEIPRVSRDQFAALAKVARADIAPGDLVFFGAPVHHVGMYIGNGMMVHAPHPGDVVRVAPAFWSDYVGAARPSLPQPAAG